VELEGTYPLPEAQRDRFLARVEIGYPSPAAELELLERAPNATQKISAVTNAQVLTELIDYTLTIRAADTAKQYVLDLVHATRKHRDVRLGASPRSAILLLRAAKAIAAMDGRDYVLPDDIQAMAVPVLSHRLILQNEARISKITGPDIMREIVASTPIVKLAGAEQAKRLPTKLFKRVA
jgi:MoxR-like ATPase